MALRLGLALVMVGMTACGSVSDSVVCGDGAVEGPEDCDLGDANGAASSCCTAACEFVAASAVCRDATGECDIAETCSGAAATCPADALAADDSPCGASGVSTCSLADTCSAGVCASNDEAEGTPCGIDACFLETCDGTGACPAAGIQTIAIIESSSQPSQNMDVQWQAVADSLGHASTIFPQTHLDNINNLQGATILIVSSGTITVPQAGLDTIAEFLASGRGVYVQGEFQATFAGNVIFEAIADSQGAAFTWGPEITGQFNAAPSGCFATTPNPAATPFLQNFAVSGSAAGPGVSPVQFNEASGAPVAFSFCRPGGGLIIVKTDQDDIRVGTGSVPDLMRNIIYRLSLSSTCVQ